MGNPRAFVSSSFVLLSLVLPAVGAATSPTLAFRSWNAYGPNVSAQLLLRAAKHLVTPRRTLLPDNSTAPRSLRDLGFTRFGVDDGWQDCGAGVNGSFHNRDGTPLVNSSRFPSVRQFCDSLHAMGLSCGFYMNNCGCAEKTFRDPDFIRSVYERSVAALGHWGVDEVKLDGCSQFRNTTLWQELLTRSRVDAPKFPLENCHNNYGSGLTHTSFPIDLASCPYTLFRTSSDIRPVWERVVHNLQSVVPYLAGTEQSLSRPGCLAFADMLEVGNLGPQARQCGPGCEADATSVSSFTEDRSHFSAWAITTSPLVLSTDLTNATTLERIWPIVSNEEVLDINQAWAGEAGRLVRTLPASGSGSFNNTAKNGSRVPGSYGLSGLNDRVCACGL